MEGGKARERARANHDAAAGRQDEGYAIQIARCRTFKPVNQTNARGKKGDDGCGWRIRLEKGGRGGSPAWRGGSIEKTVNCQGG